MISGPTTAGPDPAASRARTGATLSPAGRRPGGITSVLLHAGFFLTGFATVLLGPLIPELAAHWQVAPARLAPLFAAQFLVSSVGSVLSSYRPWRSVLAAYPSIAVGLLGLALGGPRLAVPSAALLGLGLGLGIPASNLLVAAANRHRRGAALAILNLLWGAGALACPLVFAGLRGRVEAPGILAGLLAAVALVAAALLAFGRGPAPREARAALPTAGDGGGARARPAALVLFAGMLFLYVGAESAVGGWLVTLADQIGGATAASMLVHSAFWGSLLGGRFLAPVLLRRIRESTLFAASVGVAGAGLCALLVADSRPTVALAAAICGLGMAAIFPLTISRLTAATEADGSSRVGWVFAFGGAGGAVLPWLVPEVARAGSLQGGFLVPLSAVILIGVLLALQRTLAPVPGPH